MNPQVFRSNACDLGLLRYVIGGLFTVFVSQSRSKIGFPMLPAINQGAYMVTVPRLPGSYFPLRQVANAAVTHEDASLDARGDFLVGRLGDPFWNRSALRL
jgi:hypothetical protein